MISVLSPTRICLPATLMVLPSTAEMTPRTRSCACAAAQVASAAKRRAGLLRRLDAILAHGDALCQQLVAVDAGTGEDRFALLQVGARAGNEVVVLGVGVHQDLLLAVLVLQGELVAFAGF